MSEMNFYKRVVSAQAELKAPKSQYNQFGKYAYRSCEDILEAAKPVCVKYGLLLNLSDKPVMIGERYYIEATATLFDTESNAKFVSTAYARESLEKKGMDESQITGTASSYARKYALNGLFNIDDTKDADSSEYGTQQSKATSSKPSQSKPTSETQTHAEPISTPQQGTPAEPKEYLCADCGKPFEAFTDKKGKTWSAGQCYHMAESKNKDGKARCLNCRLKIEGVSA
jgi:DNA-directed RNA polymerase subunit RPC12/RpoP